MKQICRTTLSEDEPFDLDATLGCGQAFRWEKTEDGWWRGIAGGHAVGIRQDGAVLSFTGTEETYIRRYLALDLDLRKILRSIDCDPVIHAAVDRCRGLRILRQESFETLISYICATNANIPVIRKRVRLLAENYGRPLSSGGHTFPTADELVSSTECSLREGCVMGYRAPYVCRTAAICADDPAWAERAAALPYEEAKKELLRFPGVGPKAADCILLFAFQKYEAFPVDVWIRRIMRRSYLPHLREEGAMTTREYREIRDFAWEHFGSYAGWAQEYLYCVREGA